MPQWAEILVPFLAAVIGAVSVIAYNAMVSTPKIKGKICAVGIGNLINSKTGERFTCFVALIYLTNSRKSPVHVFDYNIEVDVGKGFEKVERVFGIEQILRNQQSFVIETEQYVIEMPNIADRLFKVHRELIEYGIPINAIFVFASRKDRNYFEGKVRKYRIILEDILGHKHKIKVNTKKFVNLLIIEGRFGLKLRPKQVKQ